MWSAPGGHHETDWVNGTLSRPRYTEPAVHQSRPPAPEQRRAQPPEKKQYGTSVGGHFGSGERHGEPFAGYDPYGQRDYRETNRPGDFDDSYRRDGYRDKYRQRNYGAAYRLEENGDAHGRESYGRGAGYGGPERSGVRRQEEHSYDRQPAQHRSYEHRQAEHRAYDYSQAEARPYHAENRVHAYPQAEERSYAYPRPEERTYFYQPPADRAYVHQPVLPPAASADRGFQQRQQQAFPGQAQQYAHPQYQSPQYFSQPYNQYSRYNQQAHSRLTHQWAAVSNTSSAFNMGAPASHLVQAPQPMPQQPLKSVSAAKLNVKGQVDKHIIYGQQQQQQAQISTFDPVRFNQAYYGQHNPQSQQLPHQQQGTANTAVGLQQWDPTFFDQYVPPAEDLRRVMPGWYKQTLGASQPGPSPRIYKSPNVQPPSGHKKFDLPMRTPPQSPRSPRSVNPKLMLLKCPEPTRAYLKQAKENTLTLDQPRPLLVVLDLNGTLLYRTKRGGSIFVARPRVSEFLHYLLTNHKVMVWSSARPGNVAPMCAQLFTEGQRLELVSVWARDKFKMSKEHYDKKVQVYKQLSWIWADHIVASSCVNGREWSQENTVLIDDSVEKAASEPHNLIQIEDFEGTEQQMKTDVLGQVVGYLEKLKYERDVSAYMRCQPFVYEQDVETDWMPIVNDMH
ncbi:hypothetical protein LTR08_009026 [Meristemomyces frigidus]|nr:hypothetical protein LTR08_009026 [Meristemomyces frigidus]